MGKRKIISIILALLFVSLIPIAIAAEHHTHGSVVSTGYGETKIFGIHPQVSGDSITLFMVLPPFGKFTIAKPRFNGHLGLFLIFGDYQWFAEGPPAFSFVPLSTADRISSFE
jgi:hypothetical protein